MVLRTQKNAMTGSSRTDLDHWDCSVKMAGVTGLEPAASGVTGQRSNQLSYTPSGCVPNHLARVCDHVVYGRNAVKQSRPDRRKNPEREMVGGDGIEPPTYWV